VTILKSALKGALVAAISGGALIATATTASADVACNAAGECWHVHDRLTYPAEAGVTFHEDAWADSHRDHSYHWRKDRFDRGYYRDGVWITF
jgi:hypothetical protein